MECSQYSTSRTTMGNTGSTEDSGAKLTTTKVSQRQVAHYFRKHAKESLSNVELITLSNVLFGSIKGLDERVPFTTLLQKLGLGAIAKDGDLRGALMHDILRKVANWPFINSKIDANADADTQMDTNKETEMTRDDFTLQEVIVLVYLLHNNGFEKLGLGSDYMVKLVFNIVSAGSETQKKEGSNGDGEDGDTDIEKDVDLIIEGKKVRWELLPVVQSFDNDQNDDMSKSQLKVLLELLLPLSMVSYNPGAFDEKLNNYNTQISSITRTLYMGTSHGEKINSTAFVRNYHSFTPYLLAPLKRMFDPIVVGEQDENHKNLELNHKILTLPVLAQLSTILDIEHLNLPLTSNSSPLYQGSRDGYSINSIQSHTLNYRAHTLLLISGRTISNPCESSNFFAKFPKFHPVQESSECVLEKCKFQMAVVLSTPWRITNTKTFGESDFKLVQLSPYQATFEGSEGRPNDYAYFSNMGLGLGFGSKPPMKSKDIKNNHVKFHLGGVSLTLDSSLEKGNFRVEDLSRHDSTYGVSNAGNGSVNADAELYRDQWFKINELEIYGLGDADSLAEQRRAHEWEEREAERRRGLNSDYAESRALLELAGLVGGASSGGSM